MPDRVRDRAARRPRLPEPVELLPVVLDVPLVPELLLKLVPEHAARVTAQKTTIHRLAVVMPQL